MSVWLELLAARQELLEAAHARHNFDATLAYARSNQIHSVPELSMAIGIFTVTEIVDCGNRRFDFELDGQKAVVFEALAEDGTTVLDLVAWPTEKPSQVLSMFGRCGILGGFEAFNPSTYSFGQPLIMHRNPLEFFQAGFRGAVIVEPRVAARQMLDIPGRICAKNRRHGEWIDSVRRSVIRPDMIVVPADSERQVR